MSIQRSPPGTCSQLNTPNVITQYNSDSALNRPCSRDSDDNYFNITKRQKRSLVECPMPSTSSISDIKNMFNDLKEQQDLKFESLTKALTTIITQNQDIQKSVECITCQHEELLSRVYELENENKEYKMKLAYLELKLDQLEKSAHSSTIEIRNLPIQTNENKEILTNIVTSLSSKLCMDSPITPTDIREIFRTKSKAVIVNFTTTLHKDKLVSSYNNYNKSKRINKEKQLNTEHINLSGAPHTIFISEYLSSKTRRLFYMARQSVKTNKIFSTWTAYGKIYVKKVQNSSPVRINEEADLLKIVA
ncbi:unnamed protein product [Colias eurytheme]|nr:unnamed protein product [Colias eurytheme]